MNSHVSRAHSIGISSDKWRVPLVVLGCEVIYLLLLYFPTTESMVSIWSQSDTYMHGFLILPISGWLLWRNREQLHQLTPNPVYYPVLLLCVLGLLWLLAYDVGVSLIQQLALVAMIPVIVLTLFGWEFVKTATFPLLFLFFAVPFGESLVPILIEFTADFTVAMVQLVGIPIYREGNYFELPSGNWSVVEACSGVRYLLASVTLGALYAYLTYKSYSRRTLFIFISILVPILANGLRAFMIVMIGHLSDMKLATGIDHLIYGWIFFGIVIAIMFYVGSFWREDVEVMGSDEKLDLATDESHRNINISRFYTSAIISILVISMAPAIAYVNEEDKSQSSVNLSAPHSSRWQLIENVTLPWKPHFENSSAEIEKQYTPSDGNNHVVQLYVGYYTGQGDGSELITYGNAIVHESQKNSRLISNEQIEIEGYQGKEISVNSSLIQTDGRKVIVYSFYVINGEVTISPIEAKWLELLGRFSGERKYAAVVAMSTPLIDDESEANVVLSAFFQDMNEPIINTLNSVVNNEG